VLLEKDSQLIPYLEKTKAEIDAIADQFSSTVTVTILNLDFFEILRLDGNHAASLNKPFDLIITNPPYGKINLASPERKAVRSLGVDCPNLYAAFIALSIRLLNPHGSLTAITPRSFMNGTYFLNFREDLLRNLNISRIHLFDSRSTLFSDTGVLQENVIFSGTLSAQENKVEISTSRGQSDPIYTENFRFDQIVLPDDLSKFIRIPTAEKTTDVINVLESLPCNLIDLGLEVSTGRVVDFRVANEISNPAKPGQSPLIYPSNFHEGFVKWPIEGKKAQSINSDLSSVLLPDGTYVLVKRFSSKEEKRRS
jgi:adenine-specific DNA-methyltransferase